jgi:hypothetical protein
LLLGFVTEVVRPAQRFQQGAVYAITDTVVEFRTKVCQWPEASINTGTGRKNM